MKKMKAIENIRVGETLYKSGEEFEIDEKETQRLIDLNAAEFVNSEIEATDNEKNKEESLNVGGLKEPEKENGTKRGNKNE